MSGRTSKISSGKYFYKGYLIICHGYYPPDKKVWWEASDGTGEAHYHAHTLQEIKHMIDEDDAECVMLHVNQYRDAFDNVVCRDCGLFV